VNECGTVSANERRCMRMWINCCDSNFIRPFFWISGRLCLCCTAVNQSTATSGIVTDSNASEGNKSPLEFSFFERPQRASLHEGQTATDTLQSDPLRRTVPNISAALHCDKGSISTVHPHEWKQRRSVPSRCPFPRGDRISVNECGTVSDSLL